MPSGFAPTPGAPPAPRRRIAVRSASDDDAGSPDASVGHEVRKDPRYAAAGFVAHLMKPLEPAAMRAALSEALGAPAEETVAPTRKASVPTGLAVPTRPRIVALTADAMQDDRERCLAAGMDDYLTNPIRAAELAEALERVPTTAPPPAPSALEPDALDRLLETAGGDQEFVLVLLDTFSDEAPALLAELRGALESADADATCRAAHTLKSNAATFGAGALAERSADLEARARDGDLGDGESQLDRIESAWSDLQPALTDLRSQLA